ncbi:MAG: hypothetical protein NTY38_27780 [Acidobacteria bacterium]|nr:hypothetical protein [Acidobacteriota bacterium]
MLPVVRSENALCPLRYRRLALGEGEGSALPVPVQAADDRVLSPAEKALDVSGMLRKQQQRRVLDILEVDRREWGQVGTRQDWERYRDRRVGSLRASLGRFPERVPLTVRVVKEHAGSGYRRQDLVYQSRAGV